MEKKILKIVTALILLVTLTMVNFIYVGAGLISYAASDYETNHKNVEYKAELKENNTISLEISVENEGYFNGEVILENSNFKFKSVESIYVNQLEENKIKLNQINAGTTAKIDIAIEPIQDEKIDVGMFDKTSVLTLTGIYRDRTQKDIKIKSYREVKLEYMENTNEENIENSMEVITNKLVKISGEEKRVVQVSMNMGLKENNYPVKSIYSEIEIPTINGKEPKVIASAELNNMTNFEYKKEESNLVLQFTNLPNEENKISWKKQGSEKVVLTFIYDKDVVVDATRLSVNEKVTLYNNKELTNKAETLITKEEKDSLVKVELVSFENNIYKGKLYEGIDRTYQTKTKMIVNLANAEEKVSLKETTVNYDEKNKEQNANIIYNSTTISKESFDKVLGENGIIMIKNQNGEVIATINKDTKADENGNIIVSYQGKEPTAIEITTTTPVAEGNIEFVHTKTIKGQEKNLVKSAVELGTKVNYEYRTGVEKTEENRIKLEESKTEATFETDKDSLSTVIANNVEIRATLKGNSEQYNLFKNPVITFELPEEVEEISLNSLDLIYETELKVKKYDITGRKITVYLEGQQTQYKEGIDGAVLVLNANVKVNKKAATADSKIVMNYINGEETGMAEQSIKIVAPKDMTVVHSIKQLGLETIGQTDNEKATLARGKEATVLATEIEIINNNENAIEDVKIMGTFPTKNEQNNIDIKVVEEIKINGKEGVKVYYTENENATDDLKNAQNGWKESITDNAKVRKYLVQIPQMAPRESLYGIYKVEVPARLEYNQTARQTYKVNYKNTLSQSENEMKATTIELETGVGPKAEVKLIPTIGGKEVTDDTTVKNGEVIKYKMEVSNVGSEEIKDVTLQGNVPEGTTLVVPQDNYEYTGASYYKELPNKTYETKIDTLKPGEVATKEYEVRVNKGVAPKTSIANEVKIKYGDVTKTSNRTKMLTDSGDLRVSVKRVTDRDIDICESGTIQYFAIIENISDKAQENVKIKTNLDEAFKVSRLTLITGMESEDVEDGDLHRVDANDTQPKETKAIEELAKQQGEIKTEDLEYKEEIDIGKIEAGETKVLSYDISIGKIENSKKVGFSVVAKNNNKEQKSNEFVDNIKKAEISLEMKTNTESKYVKSGDIIEYTITISNNGAEDINGITVKDNIPKSLTVNKVSFDDEEIAELKGKNNIEINCDIGAKTKSVIKIETVVNYSEGRVEPESITNVAYAELLAEKIATTSEINHIIEANPEDGGTEEPGDGDGDEEGNEDGDVATGKSMLTGMAWFDENANGKRDNEEEVFSNVKVQLLNTKTNNLVKTEEGNILEAKTNEDGVYVLNHIPEGKYIAIFNYDNTKYALTKYKAAGVDESQNSDAMIKEVTIGNEKQEIASTDIIEFKDGNVSDINIGFIELQDFDLKLDKFVSKILIQDKAGSTVKEYNDASLAKAELDGKKINGATVIVEYKIRVSNVGEIGGYVKKIVDYMPNDMKFSSELNKDWYQTSEGLYNTSLANEKIPAGEFREVKLTLTKSMTENNTGLVNNTAEIAEDYNELGIKDKNSTPGNRVKGENDYGSADVLLGIKTGGAVYVGITIIVIAVLGIVAYVIIRRKTKNNGKQI